MPCIQFALAHKYGLWPSLCLKKQLLNTVWLCLETRINKLRKHMDIVKKARQYDFDLSWIHTFRRVLLLSRTSDISEPCQWWQGTTIWNNTMHKNQNQHSSSALTVWYAIYKYYHQLHKLIFFVAVAFFPLCGQSWEARSSVFPFSNSFPFPSSTLCLSFPCVDIFIPFLIL